MGNLNFNNLFVGLSVEQMIVLMVLVVISVLFGLMAGASIFYPMGYRRCRKDGKAGSAVGAPVVTQEAIVAALAQQNEVTDTFDEEESFVYTDDDLFNFVDEEESAEEPAAPVVDAQPATVAADAAMQPAEGAEIAQEAASVASEPKEEKPVRERIVEDTAIVPALMDIAPGTGEQIHVEGEPLRDEVFVRMEEERKQSVPLVNRTVVLNYCEHMTPLASALPIVVQRHTAEHPYDRLLAQDYTFALLFEQNKVLRLAVRLHANTAAALRQSAGDTVAPDPTYGEDWYAWVLTDIDHCEKVVAKVLDMSYKYVAHASYKRAKEGGFMPKVASSETDITAVADAYSPAADAVYSALEKQMNAKYQLHFFGKREAHAFARSVEGAEPVTVEESGNVAVLKAGSYMFATLYESYGVVKLLFRADKAYVDVLRAEHPYVGCSEVPKSEYRQWYYAILDKTFEDWQCVEILTAAYKHVTSQQD